MEEMKKIKTLKDMVNIRYSMFKDKVAFLEKNEKTRKFEEIKYSQVISDINSLGTVMNSKLNLKDKKVAVIGENSYRWFVTYMAVVCGVGVIVPLDKELPQNEILNLLKRSGASCIVYSSRKKELIENLKDELPKDMVYIDMNSKKDEDSIYSFDSLLKEGKKLIKKDKSYIDMKVEENEFRILLFTSGTTGNSKGVMLSNKNLWANTLACHEVMKDIGEVRCFSVLPMHHTYGFSCDFLYVTAVGGTVGICEGLKYVTKDIQEVKPTLLIAVPALIESISKKIDKKIAETKKEKLIRTVGKIGLGLSKVGIDFRKIIFKQINETLGGKLKYVLSGAAPIDKEIIDKLESYGFVFLQGFGTTETSPLITATRIKTRKAGTCGSAVYGTDVRIDLSKNENEESNIGEIIVKGDNVMLGYYEMEAETKKVLKDGWLHTGDLGYFDASGNLIITGRTKNVIVTTNGKKIFPEEIETLLNRLPMIEESMVYGAKDPKKELELIVTARVKLDSTYLEEKYGNNIPTDEELTKLLWEDVKKINRSLVPYKSIRKIEIKKDDFIKTTTMKIKRFEEIKKK